MSSPEEASKIEQDNRHRRAEALASLRELSRATRTLESDAAVVAVGEPEFAAIQALHPPTLDEIDLAAAHNCLEDSAPEPVTFDLALLRRACFTAKRGAGGGGSRMRMEHLQAIAARGRMGRLHDLVFLIANGRVPQRLRMYLCGGNTTPFPSLSRLSSQCPVFALLLLVKQSCA